MKWFFALVMIFTIFGPELKEFSTQQMLQSVIVMLGLLGFYLIDQIAQLERKVEQIHRKVDS